jgi:hypothetical protein
MFEVVEEELLATFMATKTINEGTDWDKQVCSIVLTMHVTSNIYTFLLGNLCHSCKMAGWARPKILFFF